MADHITEEEQIEAFKRWWKDNGTFVLGAALLWVVVYGGWNLWQNKKEQDAQAASIKYAELSEAIETEPGVELSDNKRTIAKSIANEIVDDYGSTLYADLANLYLAKLAVEDNELSKAEAFLRSVIDNDTNASIVNLANARLAKVYYAQDRFDESLALIPETIDDAYKAIFAEIRGDNYVALNKPDLAKEEYDSAIDSLDFMQFTRRQILQVKLNAIASPEEESETPNDTAQSSNAPAKTEQAATVTEAGDSGVNEMGDAVEESSEDTSEAESDEVENNS